VGPGVGNGLSTVQPLLGSPWETRASLVFVGLTATLVSVGIGGLVAVGAAVGLIAAVVPLLQAERVTININRVRDIFFKSFPPMSDRSTICTGKISL